MGSEMNYLEWEEEEDKDKTPTFAQWKKQFEKKNKIDSNAETIEELGKTFKHNRYSVVQHFRLKVRVMNITKFRGYLILNLNDQEDLLTAIFRDDNSFHFQVGSVYRLKRGQKAPSKLSVNTWVTTGPFILLIHPPVELLPLDPLDDSYNRVGWFDYVNFPEIQCDQKDSAINVVGLVCPFTKDHYVTLVDENQNELSISLGHAIEERFKEEQLSVWSVVSLKGLRLKGCDASTASVSAPRIKTCDDSVLQMNPDCPEASRIRQWMGHNNSTASKNNSRHDRSA